MFSEDPQATYDFYIDFSLTCGTEEVMLKEINKDKSNKSLHMSENLFILEVCINCKSN